MEPKKVAIVAEWLTSRGGAENVVYELAKIFPNADIFTSVFNKDLHPELKGRNIHTSFLQKFPILNKKHQLALFFLPKAIASLDLNGYDLIISSSSAFGKGITKPKSSMHICYCHTPMRWVWEPERDPRLNKLPLSSPIIKWLKSWDIKSNKNVDLFLANSQNTADKINRFYKVKPQVLYPPVDTESLEPQELKSNFFFFISRLIPYKKADLAIRACKELGEELYIGGDGPEIDRLRKMSGNKTHFLGRISSIEKQKFYKNAKATIFCANEDFGIVPVESLACGTPVIGYGKGGILEIIEDGENGVLFEQQTSASLQKAILKFKDKNFDYKKVRKSSEKFSKSNFKKNLLKIIKSL